MIKKKINLSIVIPCADDVRIKSCVESIDVDCERVVVLNGATQEVIRIVKNLKVRTVKIPERNLSKSLNVGINFTKNKLVILIDPDCIFEKGAINKIYLGLNKYPVCKGFVIFKYNNLVSKVISKVRDYSNYNPPRPYNPFLGLNKKIKPLLGGYFFDEDIHWTEDAELYLRLKKADIKIKYDFSAKVFHPPLTLFQDLRSSFRYGIGKKIRVQKGLSRNMGTHFLETFNVIFKQGILAGLYFVVWNIFYTFGYVYQYVVDPYKLKFNKKII